MSPGSNVYFCSLVRVGSPLTQIRLGRLVQHSLRRASARTLAAGGLGFILCLGGCDIASMNQSVAAGARNEALGANPMRQVFGEAFNDIQTYYLDPVKISAVALDGLRGIRQL